MNPATLLVIYCVLIAIASVAGGLIPLFVRLTHRGTELALSFVSGVMLGVGLLELLPHALEERAVGLGTGITHAVIEPTVLWLLGGFLAMFLLERFFCFHHHDVADDGGEGHAHGGCDYGHGARHGHQLTWGGAAVGLSLHSILAGVALAASVLAHPDNTAETLTGIGAFLVIVLHKPFDSLTLGALLAAGSFSRQMRHLVNLLFALAVPVGVVLLALGAGEAGPTRHIVLGAALAFSAGMFICIALSDLLPELQFHQHDRVKLTVALILGLALAWGVARLEHASHDHGAHGHQHGGDHSADDGHDHDDHDHDHDDDQDDPDHDDHDHDHDDDQDDPGHDDHEHGQDDAGHDDHDHDDHAWLVPGAGSLLLVIGDRELAAIA